MNPIRNEKQGITILPAECEKKPRGYYELYARAFGNFYEMDKFLMGKDSLRNVTKEETAILNRPIT